MVLNYIFYGSLSENRASNFQVLSTVKNLAADDLKINLFVLGPIHSLDYLTNRNIQVIEVMEQPSQGLLSWYHIFHFYLRAYRQLKQVGSKELDSKLYFRHNILIPFIAGIKFFNPRAEIYCELHRPSKSKIFKLLIKYLAARGLRVVTISQALKDKILKNYESLTDKTVIVAHDGVNLDEFSSNISRLQTRQKLGLDHDAKIVLYIGSLWLVKGVDIMFSLAGEFPNILFYLVGRQHKDFQLYLKNQSVPPNIIIKEPVDRNKVALYLTAADVLLLPHLDNNLSQSPLKLFEYLASGTPIISTRLKNILEIMPDNELLYEPGNKTDLARTLAKFWQNPEFYKSEALNNIEIAKRYTWSERAKRIRNFILYHA